MVISKAIKMQIRPHDVILHLLISPKFNSFKLQNEIYSFYLALKWIIKQSYLMCMIEDEENK